MKRLRYCLSVVVFICMFFASTTQIYALNTGFKTEELEDEIKNIFLSNVSISVLTEKPVERSIQCFDVNKNGMIALGQESADGKELCIYSAEGIFQYGYTFKCYGDFGVEWDGENINIYFVRDANIITIDKEGKILDIAAVQDIIENNSYLNNIIYSTERTVGNARYIIRNDMGILNVVAPSYSQLIVLNADGAETVLYDVNSAQLTTVLTTCILVVLFFLLAVTVIVWPAIKQNRKKQSEECVKVGINS